MSAERIACTVHEIELSRVGAVHRLAFAREQHPELVRAEARARLDLAAAIMGMDEVDERIESGEKLHSLQQQAAVELATQRYQQALADLVRGESSAD